MDAAPSESALKLVKRRSVNKGPCHSGRCNTSPAIVHRPKYILEEGSRDFKEQRSEGNTDILIINLQEYRDIYIRC